MEPYRYIKPKLKPKEQERQIYEHPENFDFNPQVAKIDLYKKFIKMIKKPAHWKKRLYEILWPTYWWYFAWLAEEMHDDNSVEFIDLVNIYWITKGVINVRIKPLLKQCWCIKKHKWKYYINPFMYHKGQVVDKEILDLFSDTQKLLYSI